jgi:hypothetical protein
MLVRQQRNLLRGPVWQGVAKLSRAVRRPRGRFAKLMGAKRKATLKEAPYRGPFSRRQRRSWLFTYSGAIYGVCIVSQG